MNNPWNRVVICDNLTLDAEGKAFNVDEHGVHTFKTVPANFVEVPYEEGHKPKTIEEAEALCEAKLSGAELTKARSIITAFKAKVAEGEAK